MPKINIELLKDAYAIIDGIPKERLNLTFWQQGKRLDYSISGGCSYEVYRNANEVDCGTLACAAGWLALHPDFQNLGLRPGLINGLPILGAGVDERRGYAAMAQLFGITQVEAQSLFNLRGEDEGAAIWHNNECRRRRLSDKDVFLVRLKEFLADRAAFNIRRYGKIMY